MSAGPLLAVLALAWVILAPTGRRVRAMELGAAVSIGTAAAGLWGVLDAAGVPWFTIVWDAPGAVGGFGAREFASAFYVVALPLAAMTMALGRERRGFAALGGLALVLGSAHFAMVASIPAAAALLVGGLVTAGLSVWSRASRTPVMVTAGLMIAAGVVGGIGSSALAPPADAPKWAVSLPMVETFDPLHEVKNMHNGRPVNARFAHERIEEVTSSEARSYLWATGMKAWEESQVVGLPAEVRLAATYATGRPVRSSVSPFAPSISAGAVPLFVTCTRYQIVVPG